MPSSTLITFNYPKSLIKSYQYWHLLLRPGQTTIGSLVLVCNEDVSRYSDICRDAAIEHHKIVQHIEHVLQHRFANDKINHIMLMMVDPAVHFHIIPRYQNSVTFCGNKFYDHSWPAPPDLTHALEINDTFRDELLKTLQLDFSKVSYPQDQGQATKKYNKMYTSGCFDIFHQGHLNILKKSKELCDYLIVGVSTDALITQEKGHPPLIPYEERASVVEANKYVDEVIPQEDKDKQKIVSAYNIDAISVGSDWLGRYPKVTCDMVYIDYTPNVSSTLLKKKLNRS